MNLKQIKSEVNLIKYAYNFYGLVCNSSGKARCPHHPPDKHPSFAINFDDGIWKWYDPHDSTGGTIVDFESKFRKCSKKEAIQNLLKIFKDKKIPANLKPSEESPESKNYDHSGTVKEIISYIYRNQDGKEILKKEKKILMDGTRFFFWHHEEDGRWASKMGGHEHIPYNLNQFENHKRIILAEGESDCNTINNLKMGEFASTLPMPSAKWPKNMNEYFKGKEIVFLYDIGFEKKAEDHASGLKEAYPDMHVFIASVPLKEKNADITDYLNQFKSKKEKQMALAEVLSKDKEFIPVPMTIMASEVTPKDVSWLWPNYLPQKRICSLSGDPGVGKSWFALDLCCRLSKGEPWGDGSLSHGPARSYYMTVEDEKEDTLRPRIDSLGGDPSMIALYNSEHPLLIDLSEESGLEKLEDELIKFSIRNGFFVADPILDFSGMTDPNQVQAVRRLLTPLEKMATRQNLVILLIGHLSKAETQRGIYKVSGSVSGWVGKCRAVYCITYDKENEKRIFSCLKSNLSFPHPRQLEFEITTSGALSINPTIEEIDIETHLNPQPGRPPEKSLRAKNIIADMFRDRLEIPSAEVEERAEKMGISDDMLKKVKREENYLSDQRKGDNDSPNYWVWIRPYFKKDTKHERKQKK